MALALSSVYPSPHLCVLAFQHIPPHHVIPAAITSFPPSPHHSHNHHVIPAITTSFPQPSRHFRHHHIIPTTITSFPRRRESSGLCPKRKRIHSHTHRPATNRTGTLGPSLRPRVLAFQRRSPSPLPKGRRTPQAYSPPSFPMPMNGLSKFVNSIGKMNLVEAPSPNCFRVSKYCKLIVLGSTFCATP